MTARVPVSGFTFVRNAVTLDFPLVPSLHSLLPGCDEVVVAVGRSDDTTLDLVRSIGDPRIRIIETEWDLTRGRAVLADQTDIALRACRHPWGIYIQADEVFADGAAERLRDLIQEVDGDPRVEGLLVDYLHFYGGFGTVATNRKMYRREVRAVRTAPALGIHSFRDAQGFRVGPDDRKIRARHAGVTIHHYGWARAAEGVKAKRAAHAEFFQWDEKTRQDRLTSHVLPWAPGLHPYSRPHPAPVAAWVAERSGDGTAEVGPYHFRREWVSFYASMLVERLTGWRPLEFRNYTRV